MPLTLTKENGIARVTLDRSDVRNAFNDQLIALLGQTFKELSADTQVRAVILKGNGKVFSAGADLNWMRAAADYSEAENRADALRLSDMLHAINDCAKPVIAVVQGAAMGGGLGLVACADVAIGVAGTKFALSEVKLGLTPATISPYVVRAVGERWARRLFATAEIFTSDLARQIGLLHEVMDDLNAAEVRAIEIAEQIAANAPGAVSDAKRLAIDVAAQPISDALRFENANRIAARRTTPEGREGVQAFLEKRSPNWQGGSA